MKNFEHRFHEFDCHLLKDKKPSVFFNEMLKTDLFSNVYPFTMLGALLETEQSPQHHPEGNVWNHTMIVVDNAAQRKQLSQDPRILMWSALLHDLGKAPTTKVRKGRITSYDHDIVGEKLALRFLSKLTSEHELIDKVAKMVRWHMQILYVVKGLPFANVKEMLLQVPLDEIALLGLCDRLGRGNMTEERRKEEQENMRTFLEKCKKYCCN